MKDVKAGSPSNEPFLTPLSTEAQNLLSEKKNVILSRRISLRFSPVLASARKKKETMKKKKGTTKEMENLENHSKNKENQENKTKNRKHEK